MKTPLLVGTIAVIAVALGLALVIPAGMGGQTTSTITASSASATDPLCAPDVANCIGSSTTTTSTMSSTSSQTETSAYANSTQGLRLSLSISQEGVLPGGTIAINVTEFNTLGISNNVSKETEWPIQAELSACPNTNSDPFGIAVYEGYYTAANVSDGTPLQIYPMVACPQFIRLVTGYDFQPNSDQATILPGSGSTPLTATVDVNGTYTGYGQAGETLTPGLYTVVAADEWGAMVFLYFQVTGLP